MGIIGGTSALNSQQLAMIVGGFFGGMMIGWFCRGMRSRLKSLPQITARNSNLVLSSSSSLKKPSKASVASVKRRSSKEEDATDWSDTTDVAEEESATTGSSKHRLLPKRDYKMVFLVRMDLEMGKGKIAAQCAHAAVGAVQRASKNKDPCLKFWQRIGQAKIALKVPDEPTIQSLVKAARDAGINTYVVHDAGRTQIAAGSLTVAAIGPGEVASIDKISGHLKLL